MAQDDEGQQITVADLLKRANDDTNAILSKEK